MEKDFYIYEHWRPDKDVCFYVGKGRRNRARLIAGRNQHHARVVAKLNRLGMTVDIRIVMEGLSEDEALSAEVERIAFYGAKNLSNLTAGGDGLRSPSAEVIERMKAAQQIRWKDPEKRKAASLKTKEVLSRPEVKLKMEAAAAARRGVKQSPETVAKRAASLTGQKRSPEQCARVRGENNPFFGKKHTPETLWHLVQKSMGSKRTDEVKAKMKEAQRVRRAREALLKPPPQPKPPRPKYIMTDDHRRHVSLSAKKRGMPAQVIEAARLSNLGRKRKPFTEETIAKMRIAASIREAKRREAKNAGNG